MPKHSREVEEKDAVSSLEKICSLVNAAVEDVASVKSLVKEVPMPYSTSSTLIEKLDKVSQTLKDMQEPVDNVFDEICDEDSEESGR